MLLGDFWILPGDTFGFSLPEKQKKLTRTAVTCWNLGGPLTLHDGIIWL